MGTMICFINIIGIVPVYYACNVLVASWITDDLQLCLIKMCQMLIVIIILYHFVIIECRHLAKGCALKCGCIGLMLFRNNVWAQ